MRTRIFKGALLFLLTLGSRAAAETNASASARATADAHADAATRPPPRAIVHVFDDGVRVPGDPSTPLPPSPFPNSAVELFALRGETVAFQVVLEGESDGASQAHAALGAFAGLPVQVSVFAEDFIDLKRPSGNDKRPGDSLAFTPSAQPSPALVGPYADALLPGHDVVISRARRAAFWVDVYVPIATAPGLTSSRLAVVAEGGVVAEVTVNLNVVDRELPYAALPVMIYYEPEALKRRIGGGGGGGGGGGARNAETELRALFHAHHVSAIRPVLNERDFDAEIPYATGAAYGAAAGYQGPGAGLGEGIVVLGAYGDLGEPLASKVPLVAKLATRVRSLGLGEDLETFLYAVDEDCKSPWPAAWKKLLADNEGARGLPVGATCGDDPATHAADLVMQVPEDLSPARVAAARARGKVVWAYNGKRPFGGSAVLDVPATDLRANAWIAARYGIPRWFYWEATSWTSYGGGKVGGDTDPFEVADSFHNKDGDHSNGDGILVYPGTQIVPGMRSYGADTVFPSVRLKNIRRGVQDVGYIRLARAASPSEADAIVARMVPSALAEARPGAKPSWSDDARPWLDARRELLALALRVPQRVRPAPLVHVSTPVGQPWGPRIALFAGIASLTVTFFAFGAGVSARRRRDRTKAKP